MILCAVYFPTTPGHITAHAEVLVGGPVLCQAFLRLLISHPGGVVWLHTTHQGVGVTYIEGWVITG